MKCIIFVLLFIGNYAKAQSPMIQILKDISVKAIMLGDFNDLLSKKQLDNQWIGYDGASLKAIEKVEKRLGISLPSDYIEFLLITNGFQAANSTEPSFCSVNRIDFLRNVDPELIEIWIDTGNREVGNKLKGALIVGGFAESQHFFLIPPTSENENWEYWFFAAWAPGEAAYSSLLEYFQAVLETTSMFIEKKK